MGARGATAAIPLPAAALLALALALVALGAVALSAGASTPAVVIELPVDGTIFNQSAQPPRAGQVSVDASAVVTDADTPPEDVAVTLTLSPDYATVQPGENLTLAYETTGLHTQRVSASLWLPEGTYTLTWTAAGTGGNSSSLSTTFVVDLTPPEISVTVPGSSGTPDVWATIDITDALTGVDPEGVEVYFRSACSSQWTRVTPSLSVLGGHTVGEVPLTLCEGTDNLVQVVASDRAGHGNYTGFLAIVFDQTPPTFGAFSPASFGTVDGPSITLSASVSDAATSVNRSSVEYQVSADGGVTWGPWSPAVVQSIGTGLRAVSNTTLGPGTSGAVRWRAFDALGNGPGEQKVIHFTVNGPPFLIAFEPQEGAQALEGQELTFSARFADPEADIVATSFYSDIDGHLGDLSGRHEIDPSGDSFRRELSVGVHNLTIVGDDGHGNRAVYTYTFTVAVRPPPDLRPFAAIGVLALALVGATWYAWREAEELDEESDRQDQAGDDA